MKAARGLYLPERGAPHWLPGGDPPGGLLYLAWGRRFYGRHPIPLRLHHGWTYMAVLTGHPQFLVGDKRHRTSPGSLIVAGPNVPYGWADSYSAASSLIVWVWTQPPKFADAELNERACWLRTTGPEGLAELQELHGRARREIQRPDGLSPPALSALKVLVDTALARHGRGLGSAETRDAHRLRLAEEWMLRHLDIRAPASALADYLALSAMGLQRLFRRASGRPPGQAFLELKMREAGRMLASRGATVKGTALALGYRHPGDFTRAYAKFHGRPPSKG